MGPALPRSPAAGPARVRADPRTGAHGTVDARRPAVPHPRRARGHDLRVRAPAPRRARGCRRRRRRATGFRYFDARDLLGFVDGTANPTGAELPDASLIGADADPDFAGGSYVVVQKYLHDMAAWAALSTEEQEAIMGRTKIDNVEIDDDEAPRKSHKTLATIEDGAGGELAILRDNMPFGRPGAGEFGT